MRRRRIPAAALVIFLAACGEHPAPPPPAVQASSVPVTAASSALPALGAPEELPVPSDPSTAAGEPFLETAPDGAVLMTWIERRGEHARVKIARFDGASWSAPSTIVAADDLFVNWADFPSVHALGGDRLAAHWLERQGRGKYAYDVRIARSEDGGATWSTPFTPHDDGTASEHGFVSLDHAPGSDELEVVWLDGRLMAPAGEGHGGGNMTLRWAAFDRDGTPLDERELDARTCECCQTALTMTPQGAVVAFRDRSEMEVRDIAVVRRTAAGWTPAAIVHHDGWTIPGCPVNGPQLASSGDRVALAWFTAPGDEGRVNVAFSADGGAAWGAPTRVDGGNPIGRVDVVMPSPRLAVVTWLERVGEAAEIRARIVRVDGRAGEPLVVGRSSSDRAAGVPRTTLSGDTIYFAWTEPGETPRLRFSRAKAGS